MIISLEEYFFTELLSFCQLDYLQVPISKSFENPIKCFLFCKNLKKNLTLNNSKTRVILVSTPPNPYNFSLPKTSFPNGTRVLGYYKVNLLEISRYDICAGNVLKTVSFNFSSNLLFDKSNTVNFFIGAKNLAGIC